MAGHSKWANTKHKKARNDSLRQKLWEKLLREVSVAAKLGGEDFDANPRLRAAHAKAKSNSVPIKNLDNAITKAIGNQNTEQLDELIYEGYGPGGAAYIVTTLTDNVNRTVADVRTTFSKFGGSIGTTGSVSWDFKKCGFFHIDLNQVSEEELFDLLIETGVEDIAVLEDVYEVITTPEDFIEVLKILEAHSIHLMSSELSYISNNNIKVNFDDAQLNMKIINKFDEHLDIQEVHHNIDFSHARIGDS
tara:strand:- start:2088 stop:2831 length:744 start_codon:yes stop_codon:yes gene_type:complete